MYVCMYVCSYPMSGAWFDGFFPDFIWKAMQSGFFPWIGLGQPILNFSSNSKLSGAPTHVLPFLIIHKIYGQPVAATPILITC